MKQAWSNVADELSGLGLKLKYHVQEEFAEDGGTEVKAALQRLANAIEETVDVVGNVAKDPAVRSDVRDSGRLFIDALSTTFDQAVSSVKESIPKEES